MLRNSAAPFNFDLCESADMIRESTRRFSDKGIAPRAAAIDRENQFPRDLWPKMGELGLHGITAPEEYGGRGRVYLELGAGIGGFPRGSPSAGPQCSKYPRPSPPYSSGAVIP